MQTVGLKPETFFEGILQHTHAEYAVKLPIFYYDNTSLTALYTAKTAKVRAYLPSEDLHPVELYPGRCLAAVSAFEYRATDIGPYNEFSLAVLVTYGKKGWPGLTLAGQLMRNKMHIETVLFLDMTCAMHLASRSPPFCFPHGRRGSF